MAQAVNVLHKDSCGCGKSELELFTVPPTQIEMNKGFWESVDPVASVQTSDTIEFLCAANPDVYTDLANSYLHVKAKITKIKSCKSCGKCRCCEYRTKGALSSF